MITVLKKGASTQTIKKINKQLSELPSKKGLDARKYCGTVKFKEDGLVLQKRLRDEWE